MLYRLLDIAKLYAMAVSFCLTFVSVLYGCSIRLQSELTLRHIFGIGFAVPLAGFFTMRVCRLGWLVAKLISLKVFTRDTLSLPVVTTTTITSSMKHKPRCYAPQPTFCPAAAASAIHPNFKRTEFDVLPGTLQPRIVAGNSNSFYALDAKAKKNPGWVSANLLLEKRPGESLAKENVWRGGKSWSCRGAGKSPLSIVETAQYQC